MPSFILNSRQTWTLINKAGLREPLKGSPLYFLPDKHELHLDDPAFNYLLENHLIETEEGSKRVNRLFAFALETCVRPEEVISVGVSKSGYPGYSVARKAAFWCECTMNREGTTKFSFPLSRSSVLMSLTGAFSSKNPEPEPSGFRFLGKPEEAFVLAVALKELREYPVGLTSLSLKKAVSRAVSVPLLAAPFALSAGAGAMERLSQSETAVDFIINRLFQAGHLRQIDDKILPSKSAELALGSFPEASFGIARTEISVLGAISQSFQVMKVGDRKLVFRLLNHKGLTPSFEWVEMDRQQIRLMICAMFVPSQVLAKNVTGLPVSRASAKNSSVQTVKSIGIAPAQKCATATGPGFCRACGARVPSGALYCGQCGVVINMPADVIPPVTVAKPVAVYCRKCGAPLGKQAVFCKKCGASRR